MTNSEIILSNRVFLMEQGVIKATEEMMEYSDEKGKRKINVPEEIHTFQTWKSSGYQVKRGEHAIAKFPIWKYRQGKQQEKELEEGQEQVKSGRCFMKMAFFFTFDQVQPIK